jgi:tRNA A-37 threonylcarbamoyl transferase component Bud32
MDRMKASPRRVRQDAGRARAWFERDQELVGRSPAALVEAVFDLEPRERLRTLPGRETFAATWRGVPCVVKRMHGDALADRLHDALHGRPRRSPGRREGESLLALAASGFEVPAVLGWLEDDGGRSAVLMERIPHAEDLEQRLARSSAAERGGELDRLARLVARLHRLGFYHRDLYLTHFVLREGSDALVLLDAGRVRRERVPRARWFAKDLAALLHSRPRSVSDPEALRFLARYLELTGRGRPDDLGRWARRVAAKASKIAAHAPRHVDPATARPRADAVAS